MGRADSALAVQAERCDGDDRETGGCNETSAARAASGSRARSSCLDSEC